MSAERRRLQFSALIDRIDALSLRERALLFAAGVTLMCLSWQYLIMDPLNLRAHRASAQLDESAKQLASLEQIGSMASSDPRIAAASRNRALQGRLAALDTELHELARDYVGPQRVSELLRAMLADQQGLILVSLKNLPCESLSQNAKPELDPGPFLHPVELVIEGDYASITAYLRALEQLPWHIHWQRLEITTRDYPVNRARLVVGALSLSRDWIEL